MHHSMVMLDNYYCCDSMCCKKNLVNLMSDKH